MSKLTNKLLKLLLYVTLAMSLFIVVVGLGVFSGQFQFEPPGLPINHTASAQGADEVDWPANDSIAVPVGLPDTAEYNEQTRVSLIKAINVAVSGPDASAWSAAHPGWRLYHAEADKVDSGGLAFSWMIILRANNSMLVAIIEDGKALFVDIGDIEEFGEIAPVQSPLVDSQSITNMIAEMTPVDTDPEHLYFSFGFSREGQQELYEVGYADPTGATSSFTMRFIARTGQLIYSTAMPLPEAEVDG